MLGQYFGRRANMLGKYFGKNRPYGPIGRAYLCSFAHRSERLENLVETFLLSARLEGRRVAFRYGASQYLCKSKTHETTQGRKSAKEREGGEAQR